MGPPLSGGGLRGDPPLRGQQGKHFSAAMEKRQSQVNSTEQGDPGPLTGSQARTADREPGKQERVRVPPHSGSYCYKSSAQWI